MSLRATTLGRSPLRVVEPTRRGRDRRAVGDTPAATARSTVARASASRITWAPRRISSERLVPRSAASASRRATRSSSSWTSTSRRAISICYPIWSLKQNALRGQTSAATSAADGTVAISSRLRANGFRHSTNSIGFDGISFRRAAALSTVDNRFFRLVAVVAATVVPSTRKRPRLTRTRARQHRSR